MDAAWEHDGASASRYFRANRQTKPFDRERSAALEVVAVDADQAEGLADGNADAVIHHQLSELMAIDEHEAIARSSSEITSLFRESRSSDEDALGGAPTGEQPRKA